MTIQELYNWAKDNDVTNCDIVVTDYRSGETHYVNPEIVDCGSYYEVKL